MAYNKNQKASNPKNPAYYKPSDFDGLKKLEVVYRNQKVSDYTEIIVNARETTYKELVTSIFPDREGLAPFENPLFVVVSKHVSTMKLTSLLLNIKKFIEEHQEEYPSDILSISGGVDASDKKVHVTTLIRAYPENGEIQPPNFMKGIFTYLGETAVEMKTKELKTGLNVEEIQPIHYTEEEIEEHEEDLERQNEAWLEATDEVPFLNRIDSYTPRKLPVYDDKKPLTYKLMDKERGVHTLLPYENFRAIFDEAMSHVVTVDIDSYFNVLRGRDKRQNFMNNIVRDYLVRTFIDDRRTLTQQDLPILMEKMDRALFDLYIIQDLIDDDQITDIKITDPYTIRVRIKGKAYKSDITFIDANDYIRFINALIIKNNIDSSVPVQTFTDERDANYILRFSITMPYISSNGYPVLHIRKISRHKMMSEDLIEAGMFDEKIRDYLLDCGKYSTGVVFAGPPGSGKTILLNWFLEDAYEDSAEILVIQENDELFAYRQGVMFQHVVNNPVDGERQCTLEDLGQMALVAGANVFVIGETKGGEICSAITLANSGCRTAMTVHSQSSVETIDKMADLAMRGIAKNYDQAKRMLKSFQTIVYLEEFKIQEISEVEGYDNDKKEIIYKPIYKRPPEEE